MIKHSNIMKNLTFHFQKRIFSYQSNWLIYGRSYRPKCSIQQCKFPRKKKKNTLTTQSNRHFYSIQAYNMLKHTYVCALDLAWGNTISLKHRKRTVIYQKWLKIKKNRIYTSCMFSHSVIHVQFHSVKSVWLFCIHKKCCNTLFVVTRLKEYIS